MIDYGPGPAHDEFELVVFGPGYGEAAAIHLTEGVWALVDSCIDPHTNVPAGLSYLDRIGVSHDSVKIVVATHWHDDHVRGFARTAKACAAAEVQISGAFNSDEGAALLAAFSGRTNNGLSRGTQELLNAIDGRQFYHLHHRSVVHERTTSNGTGVAIRAFSPTQAAMTRSVAHFAQFLPQAASLQPIRHVVPARANAEAVVLHVQVGDQSILLGADLEEHADYGWSALAADPWVQDRLRASAYKVAHHGSHTGDSEKTWSLLLDVRCTAVATPFKHGNQRLPTEDDKSRLKARAGAVYLSSAASRRPSVPPQMLKGMSTKIQHLAPANAGFGAVRLRRKPGQDNWAGQCFGDAVRL